MRPLPARIVVRGRHRGRRRGGVPPKATAGRLEPGSLGGHGPAVSAAVRLGGTWPRRSAVPPAVPPRFPPFLGGTWPRRSPGRGPAVPPPFPPFLAPPFRGGGRAAPLDVAGAGLRLAPGELSSGRLLRVASWLGGAGFTRVQLAMRPLPARIFVRGRHRGRRREADGERPTARPRPAKSDGGGTRTQ